MRRLRLTDFVRVFLATAVLGGSVGSSPMFGHSHDEPEGDYHDHLAWSADDHHDHHDHEHSRVQHESNIVSDLIVEPDDSVFHVHGTWFGIPFSLPVPAKHKDVRVGMEPMAVVALTPVVVVADFGVLAKRLASPGMFGIPPDPHSGHRASAALRLANWFPDLSGGHCALETRSGVLRC
jgi:hypothetical protein